MSDNCTCNVGLRDQFGAGIRRFDPGTGFAVPDCRIQHSPSGIVYPPAPSPSEIDPDGPGIVVRLRRIRTRKVVEP